VIIVEIRLKSQQPIGAIGNSPDSQGNCLLVPDPKFLSGINGLRPRSKGSGTIGAVAGCEGKDGAGAQRPDSAILKAGAPGAGYEAQRRAPATHSTRFLIG